MSKTLKTIQTLSKVGKILSKIAYIFSIIGAVGCLIGLISLCFGVGEIAKVGGVSIYGLIEKEAGMSMGEMIAATVVGMIGCIGEAVLAKFAELYFKNELTAGTPFTFEGAREMKKLGILSLAIPIATSIVCGIAYSIVTMIYGSAGDMNLGSEFSLGVGIMFLVMSVVCKYGAEISVPEKAEYFEQ